MAKLRDAVKLLRELVEKNSYITSYGDKRLDYVKIKAATEQNKLVKYLGAGGTRMVFSYGKFAIKLDFHGGRSNRAEYKHWKQIGRKHPEWFARTFWMSEDGVILIMEKIDGYEPDYYNPILRSMTVEIEKTGISDLGSFNFRQRASDGVIKLVDYAYHINGD